jgi:probable F420-dependent oxidoreductase
MRFGLALPHYDTSLRGAPVSWEGVRDAAQLAERCGFDSVWVSDHLFLDWSKYGGPADRQGSLECLTTLSALAAVTERVRLGSLTLCNDLRHPGVVAKAVATIDRLSGGRVELGLGAGWYEPEYAAAGIAFDPPGRRIGRLGEAAEVIKALLRGDELSYDGRHYHLDGAVVRPGPLQSPHPPLWIGGKGDLLLATAARVADGWNLSWLGPVDAYAERARAADHACERVGRDPATLRRSVGAYVLAGRDAADLKRRLERLAGRTPAGVLGRGAGLSLESYGKTRYAGTVAEVTDRLGALSGFGVEEVIVSFGALPFQLADPEDVELFAAEVVPALR